MPESELEKLVELTRKIIHDCYEGDFTRWFCCLDAKSIWISPGTPMLIGDKCIREYFKQYEAKRIRVLQREEYQTFSVNSRIAMVIAKLAERNEREESGKMLITANFIYKMTGRRIALILQQASLEEIPEEYAGSRKKLPMDLYTCRFVKGLLLDHKQRACISVPSGGRTMFVDLNTVLFIKSNGRKTEFYCLDCIFPCNLSMSILSEKLPGNFYPIHRSYMVNVRYITAVYRYEAELISGVRIPIPALPYMQIKNDLENMLCEYPRQMSYRSLQKE